MGRLLPSSSREICCFKGYIYISRYLLWSSLWCCLETYVRTTILACETLIIRRIRCGTTQRSTNLHLITLSIHPCDWKSIWSQLIVHNIKAPQLVVKWSRLGSSTSPKSRTSQVIHQKQALAKSCGICKTKSGAQRKKKAYLFNSILRIGGNFCGALIRQIWIRTIYIHCSIFSLEREETFLGFCF